MWRRCRPPDAEKLKFSFSTLDLCRFSGAIYVAYVPGSDVVLAAGEKLNAPERPRGSSDNTSQWKSWSAVQKRVHFPYLEWWSADALPAALPRPRRCASFMYSQRKPRVRESVCESIPTLSYAELPELVRRFWRGVVARLFSLVDPLALSAREHYDIAGYSQAWIPAAWSHFGAANEYPAPTKDLFINLFDLAQKCKRDGTLPISSKNLTQINAFINQLFARLSHRYGFLELSTNHLLTFALADKIVESVWSGRKADVELTEQDIRHALCYWLDANLHHYNIPIQATPTDRLLHPYKIAQQLGLTNCRLDTSVVLDEDCDFLLRNGHVDPNYIRVGSGTSLSMQTVMAPALPMIAQNRRVCAFLYSLINNDSFLAQFPLCAMPTIVRVAGKTYALSALVNLSIERLEKSF